MYNEEACRKGNTRVGCARCIRAKSNTICSLTMAHEAEFAELKGRVEILEGRLSHLQSGASSQ